MSVNKAALDMRPPAPRGNALARNRFDSILEDRTYAGGEDKEVRTGAVALYAR